MKTSPSVPAVPQPASPLRRKPLLILLLLLGSLPLLFRLLGLIQPYKVPTGGMSPSVSPGDHLMAEGFTYLFRKPHRGDVLIFKTRGIQSMPEPSADAIFIKRVAGLPGERIRIADGRLFVNDAPVPMRNASGEITYMNAVRLHSSNDAVTVPPGHYFVLGDNTSNSMDGRYWGFVPQENVKGQASFCYWPPDRTGFVK